MIQSKKWQVPFYVLMSALSLTMIFPFLWMVSTSFKFDTQVFTVPVEWIPDPVNLSNYTQVWVSAHPHAVNRSGHSSKKAGYQYHDSLPYS